MKKLFFILTTLIFCLTLFCSCGKSGASLTVHILKIGKADAIILQTSSHTILIDTGEADDAPEICQTLSEMDVASIDLLILTHYDKDHIGGAAEILENFAVKEIAEPGYAKSGKHYKAYRSAAAGVSHTIPTQTIVYRFGELSLTVYPPEKSYENENDFSLVTLAEFAGCRLLFTGDILAERTEDLLSAGVDLSADFLKVPHHGSFEENSSALISAVSPRLSAITCSDKNPPDDELLALLRASGCTVYETRNGDLRLTVDPHGNLSAEQ